MNTATQTLIAKLNGLVTDVNTVIDLTPVNGTHFLYGGLNLVYGVDGSGKSWQTAQLITNSTVANVYIDTDGANGKQFVTHCNKAGVGYIGCDAVDSFVGNSVLSKIINLLEHIGSNSTDPLVVIVDSLTSILEGTRINNAEDISPVMYKLNQVASKHNIALVIIDHATENSEYPDGFKLEGNVGAKRRATVTTARYVPMDKAKPAKGGTFICERARGNTANISKGFQVVVSTTNKTVEAVKFLVSKFPKLSAGGSVSKADITVATKYARDHWVREQLDTICDVTVEGRFTKYTIKPEYQNI